MRTYFKNFTIEKAQAALKKWMKYNLKNLTKDN